MDLNKVTSLLQIAMYNKLKEITNRAFHTFENKFRSKVNLSGTAIQ